MANGWIKLHRKSVENPMYFEEPFDKWHAWTDILLMVNHEKKQFVSKGQLVTLEPGQMVTSMAILAERWHWSVNKVRRFIGTLVGTGMCIADGTPYGTTITVVKWAFYQCEERTNGTAYGTGGGIGNGIADGTLTRNKRNKEYNNRRKSAVRGNQKMSDEEMWEKFLEQVPVEEGGKKK